MPRKLSKRPLIFSIAISTPSSGCNNYAVNMSHSMTTDAYCIMSDYSTLAERFKVDG